MPAPRRWAGNLGIYVGWVVFSFALAGIGPLAVALSVQSSNFGLLNRTWLPFSVRFLAGFLLLDLTNYWTHRLEHFIAPLWRVHQVHHADPDCDLTTGLRSHPLEFLFNQAGLVVVVATTALPAASAMAYAFLNILASFATHANGRLPEWADRCLRSVLISPGTGSPAPLHQSAVPAGELWLHLLDLGPWLRDLDRALAYGRSIWASGGRARTRDQCLADAHASVSTSKAHGILSG